MRVAGGCRGQGGDDRRVEEGCGGFEACTGAGDDAQGQQLARINHAQCAVAAESGKGAVVGPKARYAYRRRATTSNRPWPCCYVPHPRTAESPRPQLQFREREAELASRTEEWEARVKRARDEGDAQSELLREQVMSLFTPRQKQKQKSSAAKGGCEE